MQYVNCLQVIGNKRSNPSSYCYIAALRLGQTQQTQQCQYFVADPLLKRITSY